MIRQCVYALAGLFAAVVFNLNPVFADSASKPDSGQVLVWDAGEKPVLWGKPGFQLVPIDGEDSNNGARRVEAIAFPEHDSGYRQPVSGVEYGVAIAGGGAGAWDLWVRVKIEPEPAWSKNDSLFAPATFGNRPEYRVVSLPRRAAHDWTWVKLGPVQQDGAADNDTAPVLRIAAREDGLTIDRVALTRDAVPPGAQAVRARVEDLDDRPDRAVMPNAERPVNDSYFTQAAAAGSGFAWLKVMWDRAGDTEHWAKARAANERMKRGGYHAQAGLMHWINGLDDILAAQKQRDRAWARAAYDWLTAREHYWALKRDGTVSAWGWISPAMPLDEADWPEGVADATFADWTAARITNYTAAAGVNALSLADAWNGLPHGATTVQDFNPRVVDAFVAKTGLDVPSGSVAERADHIRQHHINAWTNFHNDAWAHWLERLVALHREKTGEELLLVYQAAHHGVATDRKRGFDHRVLAERVGGDHLIARIELQGEAGRTLKDMAVAAPKMALFAARQPSVSTGVQIAAPSRVDPLEFTPEVHGLSQGILRRSDIDFANEDEQLEALYQFTKQHWLGVMWAHNATAGGGLRRSAMFWQGNYQNRGRPPEAIGELVLAHVPTAPFGPAMYFSTSIEKHYERLLKGRWNFDWHVQAFSGVTGYTPVYAVSDAAPLGSLQYKPTFWITDHVQEMPVEERRALEAVAPVYDFDEQAQVMPLPFKVEGATGFAFIDQDAQTVVVIARPLTQWADRTAGPVTLRFQGIPDGTYTLQETLDGDETLTLNVRNGQGHIRIHLDRWGCRVFVGDVPAPRLQPHAQSSRE